MGLDLPPHHRSAVTQVLRRQPLLPTWHIALVPHPAEVVQVRATLPQVIVTTPALFASGGVEAEATSFPVVLLVERSPAALHSAIGAPGVRGVVVSDDPPETLALGILAAASHGVWLPEAVWEQVTHKPGPELLASFESLTAAEVETLRLIARGLSYKEIAQVRHVQLSTVKYHVGNIRLKTGASSRHHLVVLAHEAAARRNGAGSSPEYVRSADVD